MKYISLIVFVFCLLFLSNLVIAQENKLLTSNINSTKQSLDSFRVRQLSKFKSLRESSKQKLGIKNIDDLNKELKEVFGSPISAPNIIVGTQSDSNSNKFSPDRFYLYGTFIFSNSMVWLLSSPLFFYCGLIILVVILGSFVFKRFI